MNLYRITVHLTDDIVRYSHRSRLSTMRMIKLVRWEYPEAKKITLERRAV